MSDLAAEGKRLNDKLWRMMWKGGGVGMEAPMKIHERGVDQGHGLGGPPLAPALISFLTSQGVCFCEPRVVTEHGVEYMRMIHGCDRRFARTPAKFRFTNNTQHRHRLSRAMRQVRLVAPAEFDIVWLLLARGLSWSEAYAKVNDSRVTKGLPPYTPEEYAILAVAGMDKAATAF